MGERRKKIRTVNGVPTGVIKRISEYVFGSRRTIDLIEKDRQVILLLEDSANDDEIARFIAAWKVRVTKVKAS